MSADEPGGVWQAWFDDLEAASATRDAARVLRLFQKFQASSFHAHRELHDRWAEVFTRLLGWFGDQRVREPAQHHAFVLLDWEYGPPYGPHTRDDRKRVFIERTRLLLAAWTKPVQKEPARLLPAIDKLVASEGLSDAGVQPAVTAWLTALEIPKTERLTAQLAYEVARAPWDTAWPALLRALDHENALTRAVAARSIGTRYLEDAKVNEPPFKDVVALITEKELQRPGIAGPLLSDWYTTDRDEFAAQGGVDLDAWLIRILSSRSGPEPETLPVSNGIDFYAHEIFGGRPDYVKKLMELGHDELAAAAATEFRDEIPELEPVLMELGKSPNAEVCRQVSWHLAYEYDRLHPDGEKRGFVRRIDISREVHAYLNLTGDARFAHAPYALVLYPNVATFNDTTADEWLDVVLPADVRGEPVPFGLPTDRDDGASVRPGAVSRRYESGANITWRGEVSTGDWKSLTIIWHGPPNTWNPEARLDAHAKATPQETVH
jgi:hypothetical protein